MKLKVHFPSIDATPSGVRVSAAGASPRANGEAQAIPGEPVTTADPTQSQAESREVLQAALGPGEEPAQQAVETGGSPASSGKAMMAVSGGKMVPVRLFFEAMQNKDASSLSPRPRTPVASDATPASMTVTSPQSPPLSVNGSRGFAPDGVYLLGPPRLVSSPVSNSSSPARKSSLKQRPSSMASDARATFTPEAAPTFDVISAAPRQSRHSRYSILQVKPEAVAAFLETMRPKVEEARSREGCLRYDLSLDKKNKETFYVLESYVSKSDFVETIAPGPDVTCESVLMDTTSIPGGWALQADDTALSNVSNGKLVSVTAKPDKIDEFFRVMAGDANGCRSDVLEPRCARFDMYRHQDDPYKFLFYECFLDDDAGAVHKGTAHYDAWVKFKADGGVLSQTAVTFEVTSLPDCWGFQLARKSSLEQRPSSIAADARAAVASKASQESAVATATSAASVAPATAQSLTSARSPLSVKFGRSPAQ